MNTCPPQVSVIIPAYNAAQYIKQAIESVLAQTYRDFEVIVVDDGSTDNTPNIVHLFGDVIRYIYQPNRGLSAARNTAIKNAQAKVIALLDSDDVWEPQYLERMICLLDNHPKVAGVYCGFQYIDSNGDIVGRPSLKTVPPELFNVTMIDEGSWLAPCAVIFRKHLAEEVGLFDESLQAVEDWDMWVRLSNHLPFIGLPEALVKYRRHESNMSQDPERMIKARHHLIEKRYGPTVGDASTWPPSRKKAFSDHYLGATIRFFAADRIPKSVDYLLKLVEISQEYAFSLYAWRGIVRARLPVEYQFDPSPPHNWALMEAKLYELLGEFAQRVDHLVHLEGLFSRVKSIAFLALADEAARTGEPGRAFAWLKLAYQTEHRLLLSRPFWGTVNRIFLAFVTASSKISTTKVTGP